MFEYLISFSNKEWHKIIYYYSNFISIFLVIIAYTGIVYINPVYIKRLHTFLLFYVCAILLIRFNPFSNFKFTELDKKIAFTGGLFIISTTILNKSVLDYVTEVKNLIQGKI